MAFSKSHLHSLATRFLTRLTVRNAYLSINFGDFVDGDTSNKAAPYIQLLSITNDSTTAHNDFVKVRGNSASWNPSGSGASAWVHKHLALVIAVAAALGVLLLGSIGVFCFRNRRIRRTPAGFMNYQSSYQPLNEPAPQAAYDMQPVGGYAPPAGPPPGYQGQHQGGYGNYNNPWDAHY